MYTYINIYIYISYMYICIHHISADLSACGVLSSIRINSKSEMKRSESEAKRKAKRRESEVKRSKAKAKRKAKRRAAKRVTRPASSA